MRIIDVLVILLSNIYCLACLADLVFLMFLIYYHVWSCNYTNFEEHRLYEETQSTFAFPQDRVCTERSLT